jgi:putative DNA primase/helicase
VLLADPARPLIICEGELKSAKASKEGFPSIALGGVDSFRSQKAGIAFLPELEAINWEGREVFIVFDTDPATKTNKHVAMAIQTLATLLIERGAIVKRVDLPTLQEGRKCGLDDYFVAAGAPAFRELLEAAELLTRSLLEFTEDALALSFAEKFKDTLRYDHTAGAWYRWDDVAWCRDEKQQGLNLARETLQEISAAAKAAGALREKLGKVSTAANVEKFAKATPDFAVTGSIWDTDPFKLGTPGGTLDLRTGTLSAAESWSYITKLAAVAPSETAHCPQWLTFLDQVTGRDAGVIHFLQQWSGHCLSGDTREQALVFVWGPGGNGKSVFLNTIKGILGHYAQAAMMSTFITTYGNKHPTDLASMKGARLVTAVENNSKDVWDEALIKLLTGGEDIRAHHMHKDVFSFKPELKLTIIGNHKPRLMNVSDSTKRRLNFVPFTFKPDDTKIDQELEQKLKLEWPGILRWAIEGCLDWQRRGLDRPKVVLDATAEYFEAEDSFGAWISDSCALGDRYSTGPNKGKLIDSRPSVLRDSYNFWAVSNGEREIDRRRFKAQAELVPGVRYKTVNGVLLVEGIRLLEIEEKRGRAEEGEKRTEEKPGRKTKY